MRERRERSSGREMLAGERDEGRRGEGEGWKGRTEKEILADFSGRDH